MIKIKISGKCFYTIIINAKQKTKGVCTLQKLCILLGAICLFHLASCKQTTAQNEDQQYLCDDLINKQSPQAYDVCVKQAQEGNVHAQARLGVLYAKGLAGQPDWPQAMGWFHLAAKQGHPEAQYVVAESYQLGRGLERNDQSAAYWYEMSAKSGFKNAQTQLGICYLEGKGVDQNLSQANYWLTKSAVEGDPNAQYYLGILHLQSSPPSFEKAENLLLAAAQQYQVKAMLKLGDIYREGTIGKMDWYKAKHWYDEAIALKNAEAQYHVAKLIIDEKFERSYEPHFLLTLAGQNGYTPAQIELARMYHFGRGIMQSDRLAFHWYLQAASALEPEALYHVGKSYIYGSFDQKKDLKLGLQFLKQSAEKQYYPAQYELASLFLEGESVQIDRHQAIEYLRHAAVSGLTEAQLKLAKVLIEFALPQYDKVAYYWISKASETENEDALYMLGNCYLEGIGVAVDYAKAYAIFDMLSEQDHHLAQLKLGQMFYYGKGTPKNDNIAKHYFLQSAQGGNEEARNWISILVKNGLSDETNPSAKDWVNYAADLGDLEAIYIKGLNHLYGTNDYEQNIELGMNLLENAAEKKYSPAQRELGLIYSQGLFGFNDEEKAKYWLAH